MTPKRPTLKYFILLGQAKSFYRKLLKFSYKIEDKSTKQFFIETVKERFRSAAPTDEDHLKYMLSHGANEFEQFKTSFLMSRSTTNSEEKWEDW